MDTEALKRRISLGEDSATKFKSAAKAGFRLDADAVAKEIAALANSGGGELIVGVEDDGAVSGLGDSKQADQALALVAQPDRCRHPHVRQRSTAVAPDARVSAVRVAGTAFSGDFATRLEIPGRLGKQTDDAVAFLTNNTPAPARIQGMERSEQGIPEAVLREAMLNALVHRDYRAASQVRLVVFTDRVEIVNPGILLNHLTIESIRLGGISQRRNPVLAALLARARRRENLGFGVPEMLRLLHTHGFPEPEFEQAGGHFRLVIRLPSSRT